MNPEASNQDQGCLVTAHDSATMRARRGVAILVLLALGPSLAAFVPRENQGEPPNYRRPTGELELRYWLENMVWYHQFSTEEMMAATGLERAEIEGALSRLKLTPDGRPPRGPDAPLLVLPYPGGRHPRIGFRDGAVRPRRETKVSVFTPWDPNSYVVIDAPEAIWSNLGLTYLAHTHVPTVWTKQDIELEKLEWRRRPDGSLEIERRLPNDIVFGTRVVATHDDVRMETWLRNGTPDPLSDLRVQLCVMLRGASGFEDQTNDNKVFASPYVACRNREGNRWIISAWEPCHRAWGNPPCPCLHSDPKFPDCPPGEIVRIRGRLWFYQGDDINAEFHRLDQSDWRIAPSL